MDLYTKDGKKVVHLLPLLLDVQDGDVLLARVGREFGQTQDEINALADTLRTLTSGRVKVIVVDESTSIEVVAARDLKPRFT